MSAERLERFQGCLVGIAIGDALGMPVEGMSKEKIRQSFGILKDMVDGIRPAGNITDDTMQTLCLAESIVELGEFNPDDAASRLLNWFRTDPFGIGVHTQRVLSLVDKGMNWRKAVEEVENRHAPWTAGNGSLMRCSPIGLRYYRDIGKLLEYSHESSLLTHANPLCKSSCAFFNAILSRILRGWEKKDALSFAMEVLAHAPHQLLDRVQEILSKSAEEIPTSGFVLDTLQCALWAWWHYEDFENALITVVNLGGDTDTNAAVAGALLGSQYGLKAIPKRWQEKLKRQEEKTILDKCINLATQLYELAERE
ncbi:MAG: ADP-ribosylglycohydrolase family protein [Armatimonadetes bacterium]|nr:ADP-ribosylglycohydrolase family protein [Armatimonadota bacterium]